MGVKRAMDMLLETAGNAQRNEPVYTDGPLIHNPQVLAFLEQKGIGILTDASTAEGSNVVIRAHGITPARKNRIEKSGARVCDATCPNVKSVQTIIKRYTDQGYATVIVGDRGHAEVDGLLGFSDGRGHVVENPAEVDGLPDFDKVCVVSQTTQSKDVFTRTAELLKQRYLECKVFETICSSTSKRQRDVIDLSTEVDAMVVVGGRGSANTKRLAEISEGSLPTFLVETEIDLDMEKLKDYSTIGVTAGASTPNWMISRVVDKIESCETETARPFLRVIKTAGRFGAATCIYLSIGAGLVSYASSVLLGVEPNLFFCAIAALFVFFLYMLNNLVNKESISFNDPQRAVFYDKYRPILFGLGILCAALSTIFGLMVNLSVFCCLLLSAIFGFVYGLKIIPERLSNVTRYTSLAQIPGTKEVFASAAWSICTVLIIFLGNHVQSVRTLAVTFAFTFAITFIRGVFLDIKDFQGDKLIGKETIPVALGKEKTKDILIVISLATAGLLFVSPRMGWTSNFSLYLLPCLAYACSYLYLYHKRIIKGSLLCETIADGNFLLVGIMAYIWRINQI